MNETKIRKTLFKKINKTKSWLFEKIKFTNLYQNKLRKEERASLVTQWLRIRLPMQGTQVQALVREDLTCCGATKPMHHNY